MKNKFYKYFFKEFLSLLTLIILSLACVVWAVQAVNFLDLVTEGGHSFRLYFSYTILGFPKILLQAGTRHNYCPTPKTLRMDVYGTLMSYSITR